MGRKPRPAKRKTMDGGVDRDEMLRAAFDQAAVGVTLVSLDDVRAASNVHPDTPVLAVDARDRGSMTGAALRLLDLVLTRARSAG